jgi:outer membrane protein assembly factor BamB
MERVENPYSLGPYYPFAFIADITGDGRVELIRGGSNFPPGGWWRNVIEVKAYSLHGSAIIPLWTTTKGMGGIECKALNIFTIQDVSGDGFPDIIMVVNNEYANDCIIAISGLTGEMIWSSPGEYQGAAISIEDVSGDGKPDILASSWGISLLEGATGKVLWTTDFGGGVTALAELESKTFLVGLMNGKLYIINSSGSTTWGFSIGEAIQVLKRLMTSTVMA